MRRRNELLIIFLAPVSPAEILWHSSFLFSCRDRCQEKIHQGEENGSSKAYVVLADFTSFIPLGFFLYQ